MRGQWDVENIYGYNGSSDKKERKAYDTRSDMSHTTCWIRQNLGMSDRVSPPKTPRDTIRQCCKKNRTCSIFIRLQPTLSNGQTNQMAGICTRGYVYVLCVCPRADINVSTCQM